MCVSACACVTAHVAVPVCVCAAFSREQDLPGCWAPAMGVWWPHRARQTDQPCCSEKRNRAGPCPALPQPSPGGPPLCGGSGGPGLYPQALAEGSEALVCGILGPSQLPDVGLQQGLGSKPGCRGLPGLGGGQARHAAGHPLSQVGGGLVRPQLPLGLGEWLGQGRVQLLSSFFSWGHTAAAPGSSYYGLWSSQPPTLAPDIPSLLRDPGHPSWTPSPAPGPHPFPGLQQPQGVAVGVGQVGPGWGWLVMQVKVALLRGPGRPVPRGQSQLLPPPQPG